MSASFSSESHDDVFYPTTDRERRLHRTFFRLKEQKNKALRLLAVSGGIDPALMDLIVKRETKDAQAFKLFIGFQKSCMEYAAALPDQISLGDILVSKRQFAGFHVLCSGWDRHQIQYGDLPAPYTVSTFFQRILSQEHIGSWNAASAVLATPSATLSNSSQPESGNRAIILKLLSLRDRSAGNTLHS